MVLLRMRFFFYLLLLCLASVGYSDLLTSAESRGNESRNLTNQGWNLLRQGRNQQARQKADQAIYKAKEAIKLVQQYETAARKMVAAAKYEDGIANRDQREANQDIYHGYVDETRARKELHTAQAYLRNAEVDKRDAEYDRYLSKSELKKLEHTGKTDSKTVSRMNVLKNRIKDANVRITRANIAASKAMARIPQLKAIINRSDKQQSQGQYDKRQATSAEKTADRDAVKAQQMLNRVSSARSRYRTYLTRATTLRGKAN